MRKISFESCRKETGKFGLVPGASDIVYTFYRVMEEADGVKGEYFHTIPLCAVADAMTNFGFTAEEALEYHMMVNEAALFPEQATTLARSAQEAVQDPDVGLLGIFDAGTKAVKDAIAAQHSALGVRAFAGEEPPPPTEEEVADLVFDVLNPPPTTSFSSAAKEERSYAEQRATLKSERKSALDAAYVVDKKSKGWVTGITDLKAELAKVTEAQKAISNFRFQDFIKEGASRRITPIPPGQPTPDPPPDPGQQDTSPGETGDTPVQPPKPTPDPKFKPTDEDIDQPPVKPGDPEWEEVGS